MIQPAFTAEVPSATMELLVLKTLEIGGAMQAYSIVRFIHATSEEVLRVEAATLYRALQRLAAQGWVLADGGRGARSYRITAAGRESLARAAADFDLRYAAVRRILQAGARPAQEALVE